MMEWQELVNYFSLSIAGGNSTHHPSLLLYKIRKIFINPVIYLEILTDRQIASTDFQ